MGQTSGKQKQIWKNAPDSRDSSDNIRPPLAARAKHVLNSDQPNCFPLEVIVFAMLPTHGIWCRVNSVKIYYIARKYPLEYCLFDPRSSHSSLIKLHGLSENCQFLVTDYLRGQISIQIDFRASEAILF